MRDLWGRLFEDLFAPPPPLSPQFPIYVYGPLYDPSTHTDDILETQEEEIYLHTYLFVFFLLYEHKVYIFFILFSSPPMNWLYYIHFLIRVSSVPLILWGWWSSGQTRVSESRVLG